MRTPPPDAERCEATRATTYYSDAPGKMNRCEFLAHYQIGKKRLCARHAGGEALKVTVHLGRAVRINRGAA